jgi:SAM-dependent methyltransferase
LPRLVERSAPGDAFGRTAREYEFGRPEWPGELLDRVISESGIAAEATVLDVGAGTGKLTRALAARFTRVIAVEPDDEMRTVLEEVVPGVDALAGEGKAIPVGDDSVDAAFSGEAFHWFATRETVAELERVLRPGGVFVFLWNIFEAHVEPELGEASRLISEAFARGGQPGQARVVSGEWRQAFEGSGFGRIHEDELVRDVATDRERWLANILSVSSIAAQSAEVRAELTNRLRELAPVDAEYRRRFRTVAYWTRLTNATSSKSDEGDQSGRK